MHNLLLTLWMALHPVHVSLTSIDLVPGTDSLKVYVKLYYDDFLKDLATIDELSTVDPDEKPGADKVTGYMSEKVKIRMDNKELKGKLLNMLVDGNEFSLNLLYRSVRKPKSISVESSINAGLYADQANMLIIRINELEEGFKLTPEDRIREFRIKTGKEPVSRQR